MAIQNQIVFCAGTTPIFSTAWIYTINPDGSSPTQITAAGSGWDYAMATPDGLHILAMKNVSGTLELFLMNADGTGATRITNMDVHAQTSVPPTFSPDGTKFVLPYGLSPTGACIVNADNSGFTNIPLGTLGGGNSNGMIYWSPDGTKLAFPDTSGTTGFGVSVCHIDGTAVTAVKDGAGFWYDVFGWYADSSTLLIQAMGTSGPFPITIEKSDGTVLYTDATEISFQGNIMGPSPDGTEVIFFDQAISPFPGLSILSGGAITPFLSGPPYPLGGINGGGGHYLVQWVPTQPPPPVAHILAGQSSSGIVKYA